MQMLESILQAVAGLRETLEAEVITKAKPFLGICVGMQLMADLGREHEVTQGLGWIKGSVRQITPSDPAIKVPHMGWNDVVPVGDHPLILPGEAYFLHSFAFSGDHVLAHTHHGAPLVAAIGRDNVAGVQFHPEKSQHYGIALLSRLLEWCP